MKGVEGLIFNIQRFSTHDGPGIRTVVFFKGCTLRCAWCHNPESIAFAPALLWHAERCIGCGRCVPVCPNGAHRMTGEGHHVFDRTLCDNCLKCVDSCYAEALQRAGETCSAGELLAAILTDVPYYGETGGVTFSGGECLAQPAFLAEVLIRCREAGIHTAVDTAGAVPWQSIEGILPYTDLFLYDIKAVDPELHRRWTGADNAGILENLRRLRAAGAKVRVRVPFVPQANGRDMDKVANLLDCLGIREVDLLPYHRLGEGKRLFLGLQEPGEPFLPPTDAELAAAAHSFEDRGIHVWTENH